MSIGDLLLVEPGSRPDLDAIDPAGTPGWDGDKAAARDRLKELRAELGDFQERLWAESSQSLLIVLQALDAGGKDGLIRKVITAFNPQGTRVTGSACRAMRSSATTICGASMPTRPAGGASASSTAGTTRTSSSSV